MPSTIERAGEHLASAVRALGRVSGDVRAAGQLLALLGWTLPPGVDDIGLASLDVATVAARLDALTALRSREDASDLEQAAAVAELVVALADAFRHAETLGASFHATPEYFSATRIADEFFPRLADLLVIHAVGSVAPPAVPFGVLLGVFELTLMPADPAIFQAEHVRQVVRWDRLSPLLSDPTDVLHEVYGWGTATFDGNTLITNLGRVLEYLAADARVRPLPRAAEEQLAGRAVPEADAAPGAQLFVSLAKGLGFDRVDVGLSLYPLRPTAPGATDGGLGLSPYAFGTTETSFPLSDTVSLILSASPHVQGGVSLMLRAGRDPELKTGLLEPPPSGAPPAAFALTVRSAAPEGNRNVLFSGPGLLVDAVAVKAGVGVSADSNLDPTLTAGVEGGRIRIAPENPDGFLASILPADGITTDVNLDLAWSQRGGLLIRGGAGLRTTIGLNKRVGPLRLDRLDLALAATPDAVTGAATVTGGTTIGPLTATVDSIGAAVALRFKRGNLGPVDLAAEFLPPSGIGLAIDAKGVVSGGGFLFHDRAQEVYAGVMQVTVYERITVKAFGLVATRMPGGAKGYSLLVFITAEDFRPIPIGMGLTLLGIGGMVGIHRTFSEEAMREGLRNNTLATLLFPRDPIRNAPEIIRNLATTFPAANGSYLFGLLAKIGWLSPPLVILDLGVIFEFGARTRLIVLGRISALLPTRQNDLVRLNLDALGLIDFDQGTASIDAVLVDSRLAHKFPLTGAMALRARFGSGARDGFVMAVGGLNPRFAPPAGMPRLDRVTIALASGDNPRLTCEAYFAITANTIQFGARAQLYAAAYGFSVQGDVGFDVLVQFAPFHFLADFQASVQLKRGSRSLFKVSVAGALEGPRPLRVSGKASFEIFWCDFTVRFDKTLIGGEKPPLPPAVDVLAELRRALADGGSWSTQRTASRRHGVSLRKLAPGTTLVLDPLGVLVVKQQVVPLNTTRDIETFGGAPVAGARRFSLGATLNGDPQTVVPVKDAFAPAQFFVMSDDEKLASPSFEEMDAGLAFGSDAIEFDATQAVAAPLVYESIVIDATGEASQPPEGRYTLTAERLLQQTRFGAVARAPARDAGLARFRAEDALPAATLREPAWVIASVDDARTPPPAAVGGGTWSERRSALAALNRAAPGGAVKWQLVPAHELA